MFLAKTDLLLKILLEELNEITRADDTLVNQALLAAESELRGYLFDSFDVDPIFAATGTARHPMLVDACADIAVWLIAARVQAGIDLDDRQRRYERAIAWAKAMAKTEFFSDLPRREDTIQKHIVYGSNPKRSNYF